MKNGHWGPVALKNILFMFTVAAGLWGCGPKPMMNPAITSQICNMNETVSLAAVGDGTGNSYVFFSLDPYTKRCTVTTESSQVSGQEIVLKLLISPTSVLDVELDDMSGYDRGNTTVDAGPFAIDGQESFTLASGGGDLDQNKRESLLDFPINYNKEGKNQNFAIQFLVGHGTQKNVNLKKMKETGIYPYFPADELFPLSTKGRYIIDKQGRRFKFHGANWYGASQQTGIVEGLHKQPLEVIVKSLKAMNLNIMRMPWSNEMLRMATVKPELVAANPHLMGRTGLQVFDAVVEALTDAGIAVILNNHSTHNIWCCAFEEDGLWYTQDHSEEEWIKDWEMMVNRYKHNKAVIGADLRNEVRTAKWRNSIVPMIPFWGGPGPEDWHAAAQKAGRRIQKVNPDILVIVEGVNFPRIHLRGVKTHPIRLDIPNKLVYAAHNYAFTQPGGLIGKKYGDMEWDEYKQLMDEEWGFVMEEGHHCTAPVWLSEFGENFNEAHANTRWFGMMVRYIKENDVDWAYWSVNPHFVEPADSSWGLLYENWKDPRSDYRTELLKTVMEPNP